MRSPTPHSHFSCADLHWRITHGSLKVFKFIRLLLHHRGHIPGNDLIWLVSAEQTYYAALVFTY